MLRTSLLLLCIWAISGSLVFGQDWDREQQDPHATELWSPVPPKVTPGEGTAPPSDAIILFDGTDLKNWTHPNGKAAQWVVEDGAMTVKPRSGGIQTKQEFRDVQLHIEWRSPIEPDKQGQGRGNSGVFLMGIYEVQVLESHGSTTYSNGQAGSIYKQHVPLVNATRPAGEWQSYDIIFTAPVFGESGRVIHPATMTVFHNGVLIQNHVSLMGNTPYKGLPTYDNRKATGPISLQDHSNEVSYRNVWVREL
ncbi:MAG: DUF1080 domain-containing protein [Bacteroidota bacterium]